MKPSKLSNSLTKKTATKSYIDNNVAKSFLSEIYEQIRKSKTADGIKAIPDNCSLSVGLLKKMPGKEFPRLEFELTHKQLKELKDKKIILDDNRFSPELASGKSLDGYELNTLEKLLFSMLWKQGDLGKERHIISGISDNSREKAKGHVFYAFGKYLAKKNDYIIDQHTLRFFAVLNSSGKDIEKARKLRIVDFSRKDQSDLEHKYKEFYASICKNMTIKNKSDFCYEVDRLLFGAGALVKL